MFQEWHQGPILLPAASPTLGGLYEDAVKDVTSPENDEESYYDYWSRWSGQEGNFTPEVAFNTCPLKHMRFLSSGFTICWSWKWSCIISLLCWGSCHGHNVCWGGCIRSFQILFWGWEVVSHDAWCSSTDEMLTHLLFLGWEVVPRYERLSRLSHWLWNIWPCWQDLWPRVQGGHLILCH